MRIWLLFGVLLISLAYIDVSAQEEIEFPIPDSLEVLAIHSTEEGYVYLFSRHGLYELNNGSFELRQLYTQPIDRNGITSYQSNSFLLASCIQGFYEFSEPSRSRFIDLPVNRAHLFKTAPGSYLLSADKIFKAEDNAWRHIQAEPSNRKGYAQVYGDTLIYASNEKLICLEPSGESYHLIHLEDNTVVSAWTRIGNTFFIASRNTLYTAYLKEKALTSLNEFTLADSLNILKLIPYGTSIIALDPISILEIDTGNVMAASRLLHSSEENEWVDIAPSTDYAFWLADKDTLRYVMSKNKKKTMPVTGDFSRIMPFTIRSNYYFSDGLNVYIWNANQEKWLIDPGKNAPINVIHPPDGHPVLIFENTFIRINKSNGLIIDYSQLKENKIQDYRAFEGGRYILTDQELIYGSGSEKLNYDLPVQMQSLSVDDTELFVCSGMGIYALRNERFFKEFEHNLQIRDFDAYQGFLIFLDTKGQLYAFKRDTKELVSLPTGSLSPQTIHIYNNTLYAFTSKSILAFSLDSSAFDATLEASITPLPGSQTETRVLGDCSGAAFYFDGKSIVYNQSEQEAAVPVPSLRLENLDNRNIQLYNSNHWTQNVKYNYVFSGENGSETVWTRDKRVKLPTNGQAFESVSVQSSDDIFGTSNERVSLRLPATAGATNPLFYFLCLLLIFACVFGGTWLIRQ